jgi:hypothetical protein
MPNNPRCKAVAQPPAWEVKANIMASDRAYFTPVLSPDPGLGWSIDVSGDTLIAGSWTDGPYPYWDSSTNTVVEMDPPPGSARVFVRTNPESNVDWEQQGDPLIVDDGEGGVYEGYRVAIDGDTALISVRTVGGSFDAGLFVFERTGDVWEQTAVLHKSTPHYGDDILRIALEGNTGKLLISFNFAQNPNFISYLARHSLFVLCLAVVGQPVDYGELNPWDIIHGKVYVYTRLDDGTWIDEPQVLTGDEVIGDYFGDDVAISGDRILVGASERGIYPPNDDTDYISPQRGKAFVFVNNGGTWVQEGGPLYPDDEATDPRFHFGAYVALDGDTAIIGHDSDIGDMWWDEETQQEVYSNLIVYGFSRTSSGDWEPSIKLTPSVLPENEIWKGYYFGRGVELNGDKALIEGNMHNAILLVDWQYDVKTESALGYSNYYWRVRGDRLALGSNEFFLGGTEGADHEGQINVIDNFSILSVRIVSSFPNS